MDSEQIFADQEVTVTIQYYMTWIYHSRSHVRLADNKFPDKNKLQRRMESPVMFVFILATITFETGEAELFSTWIHFSVFDYIHPQFRQWELRQFTDFNDNTLRQKYLCVDESYS